MASWDDFVGRLGYFKISTELIESEPFQVMRVLSQVIIVEAESLFIQNLIKYKAYSGLFDVVGKGRPIPEYQPIVHSKNGEFDYIEWKRIEDKRNLAYDTTQSAGFAVPKLDRNMSMHYTNTRPGEVQYSWTNWQNTYYNSVNMINRYVADDSVLDIHAEIKRPVILKLDK